MTTSAAAMSLDARARQSLGSSDDAIYRMVARALAARSIAGEQIVDVGCGHAGLRRFVGDRFRRYTGLDAVQYAGLPSDVEFHQIDLDAPWWPVAAGQADLVAAVETIEHLENPWAFVRALAELARPGGWVVVTTPNQLSALSLLTVLVKQRFSSFQDVHYPAHRTALLEIDLRRAAREGGLESVEVIYSHAGRIPFTGWHYPAVLAETFPRALSDNVLMIGRRPIE